MLGKEWISEREEKNPPWTETHPYTYKLRSGTVQRVNATLKVERSINTRKTLRWLGWPKTITYEIAVAFDGEVGERAGSWKGGTIGCGYTMRPGRDAGAMSAPDGDGEGF